MRCPRVLVDMVESLLPVLPKFVRFGRAGRFPLEAVQGGDPGARGRASTVVGPVVVGSRTGRIVP